MTRQASVPIYEPHISEAIETLGGRASQDEIAKYIWRSYPELVRPDDPDLCYTALKFLKSRVSAILTYRKSSFRKNNGGWQKLKERSER